MIPDGSGILQVRAHKGFEEYAECVWGPMFEGSTKRTKGFAGFGYSTANLVGPV